MRYDKLFLVGLLLITIFMIGAASAAEDGLNNNLTADTNIDDTVSESIDEINEDEQTNGEILSSDNNDQILSEKQDSGMYLRHDAEYKVDSLESDEGYWVTVKFPQKVTGNLSCFIDNKHFSDKKITAKTHYFKNILFDAGLLSYGEHEVEIRYTGDDNYKSAIIKEKFNVTYPFDVSIDNEKNYEATIDVILPYDANEYVTYTVNGKKYSAKVTHGSATIKTDLELGNNAIIVSYEDKDYPLKTFTENVFVESKIVGPTGTIRYGETEPTIMLKLPADAKGNLHIYTYDEDSDESIPITIKKVPLVNGEAKYTIEDIHLGENQIYAEYDGTDYELDYEMIWFDVAANLVYQNKMWANATNKILVDMPDGDEADISIHLSYYDYENDEDVYTSLYEGTHKGKFYITLPNLTANQYTLESEINGMEGTDYFEILKKSPNSTLTAKIIYKQNYISNSVKFEVEPLENGDGTVLLYIDGKLNDEKPVSDFDYTMGNLESITPGIHEVELKFVNDTYYKPTSIKGKISLSYFKVPDGEDILFEAYVADDATGYVNLIIDGEIYDTKFINGDITYMNLDNLSYEKHNYIISYSGDEKYPSEQKSGTFENTYLLDIWLDDGEFIYGEQYITIEIPKDGTGCATVSIDGKNPQVFKEFFNAPKAEGLIRTITLSDLKVGTHKITLSYSDDKYPLKTIEREFKILAKYIISGANSVEYKTDTDISLILPPNATGNLVIDINGDKKSIKLVNGKAKYSLKNLTPGYYDITAYYDGNDYKVEPVNMNDYDEGFLVWPSIDDGNYGTFNVGEDNIVSIEIQKEAKGKINVKIEKENEDYDYEIVKTSSINLIDGKGSISLSDLKAGEYHLTFEYDGSDLIIPTYDTYITILIPNNITVDFPEKMYSNENPQMIFKSPTDTSGKLTVTIDGKSTKYSLSNGTIIIPLTNLDADIYEITLKYVGDKTGSNTFLEDVYIEKANPHLNITQTSDSIFDIDLEKDATGKILLSVAGKTYEEIISNGHVTVTIPKLAPGSHKVIVAYSGDSNYTTFNTYTQLNIEDKSKIIASDLAMMYNDGSKYSVTVYNVDGQLASGVVVTFKADGKNIGSAKTNSKGIASLKITQVPKTYKISATALGKTVTKKLTVKQILTLKKVTVKKSAKKLVLTATLKKVKGKFLKSKKITFKFNGKTFKAKTDKKGVAKVTIKSSVLKKLKVGKKVTYSATYVKDTVKKSVKVKK